VPPEPLEPPGLEKLVLLDHREKQELPVHKEVLRAPRERLDLPAQQALQEILEKQALLGLKVT
jgi:hypothetical protein